MKQILIASVLLLFIVASAFCHRLDIAYSLDGDDLVVEAWMGRDEPTAGAEVTLLSDDGAVIQQGKMDERGVYRTPLPDHTSFKIRVFAGRGHQNDLLVAQDDLTELRASLSENDNENPESAHIHAASNSSHSGYSTQDQFSQPVRIIMGFILITSLVAAWFAYRADQRLRSIEKRLDHLEP